MQEKAWTGDVDKGMWLYVDVSGGVTHYIKEDWKTSLALGDKPICYSGRQFNSRLPKKPNIFFANMLKLKKSDVVYQ